MRSRLILTAWAALSLAGAAAAQGRPEPDRRPDFTDMSQAEIRAVTRAMPKGGDLHIHLSGAPYGETYLRWAAEDGLCVDIQAWALTDPCTPDETHVLASALTLDQRSSLMDSLSTRRPGFAHRSGHDQFFTAFDRFGWTRPERRGDMLADLMTTLALQNTFYVEVMWMPQSGAARGLGREAGWNDDLSVMDAALAPDLPAVVEAARAETDAVVARARQLLRCDPPAALTAGPDIAADEVYVWNSTIGCEVTVRFLVQTNRIVPPAETYGQMALGEALIAADARWVGLQLVAPEDHPNALANYGVHMAMVRHLTERGVPVTLHAGELTRDYATPFDLSFHVAQAVEAGARRIGHGISIPDERDPFGLVATMAERGVAVEVNLTSNDVILGVQGEEHPVIWLRQAGVPVVYTTDDPGIARSDLSAEYARAAIETNATYDDLVTSGRNALAFSFLPGESLWLDRGAYLRLTPDCASALDADTPSAACDALVERSPLAREQLRFEQRLADFEQNWAERSRP